MMAALPPYAFPEPLNSSRRIARACEERLDAMAVTGMQRPDFRTIGDFRQRQLAALAALFVQALRSCFVKLGHVALGGTKLEANSPVTKSVGDESRCW